MENGNRIGFSRKKGRKMSCEDFSVAKALYFDEGLSVREVADIISVSHMTVWRALSKVSVEEVVGDAAWASRFKDVPMEWLCRQSSR